MASAGTGSGAPTTAKRAAVQAAVLRGTEELLAQGATYADLNIEHDANSTPWLEDVILKAATQLGYQSHFFARTMGVTDDHMPFVQRGVPSADLIDFDYGYNDVFHHTTDDTVDKLSSKSLEIVGTVTLETLRMINQR